MQIIDTHAHLDGLDASGGLDAVLERARMAGVTRVVAVGANPAANGVALAAAAGHPGIVRAAVGLDRDCASSPYSLDELRALVTAASPQVVAVGEIGLDFHYLPGTAPDQERLFEAQLALARELRLPVIVHSREADELTLALLEGHAREGSALNGRLGVLHCFTGEWAFARRILDLGLYISFSGILTFRNAEPLRSLARRIPEDRLLIETDTPYLTPVPYRGRPNEPAFLVHVAECLAAARQTTLAAVAAATSANAQRLFGW